MNRLVVIAKHLARDHHKKLLALKRESKRLQRHDFIWEALLRTLPVTGNSRGLNGLMETPENHNSVSYGQLRKRPQRERRRVVENTLRRAGVRWARKAFWLNEDFDVIEKQGGPRAYTERLLVLPGKECKIAYLRKLKGIGEQSARNLMMNVHHPDFRDSIKVDERFAKVSKKLGLRNGADYQEKFYCSVAQRAGLEGWELDRLLYNFTDEFLSRLDC
jgi:hypothetical protein